MSEESLCVWPGSDVKLPPLPKEAAVVTHGPVASHSMVIQASQWSAGVTKLHSTDVLVEYAREAVAADRLRSIEICKGVLSRGGDARACVLALNDYPGAKPLRL
jgi:hypothetical protein